MSWRFRKRLKIFPGVRLNIGRRGITSASVGRRGLSFSVGRQGTFLNAGIPGTGISNRQRLTSSSGQGGTFKSMFALGFILAILLLAGLGFLALLILLTRF